MLRPFQQNHLAGVYEQVPFLTRQTTQYFQEKSRHSMYSDQPPFEIPAANSTCENYFSDIILIHINNG